MKTLFNPLVAAIAFWAGASYGLEVKGIAVDTAIRVPAPPNCWVIKSWYDDFGDMDGNIRREVHKGLDIIAPKGTAVIAAAPGRVVYTGRQLAGGNALHIFHGVDFFGNHLNAYYIHLDEFKVQEGQIVKRGEVVGTVGNTGSGMPQSQTPHLHFEVKLMPDDKPVFRLGWLLGSKPASPNYFFHPIPSDGRVKLPDNFPAFHIGTDYGDTESKFTGFTFPLACTSDEKP